MNGIVKRLMKILTLKVGRNSCGRISPNITIEAGMDDSNQTDKSHFIQTRFKLAEFGGSSRSSATSNFVDDKAFRLRDMSEHTMDRVRRSDKITIEREYNGSIVVRRSN